MSETIIGADSKARCRWSSAAPEFPEYHDTEWGFPVSDDYRLFDKLTLEGFQSGLSWRTILTKREISAQPFTILISTKLQIPLNTILMFYLTTRALFVIELRSKRLLIMLKVRRKSFNKKAHLLLSSGVMNLK